MTVNGMEMGNQYPGQRSSRRFGSLFMGRKVGQLGRSA
jgi:hypothetical protein